MPTPHTARSFHRLHLGFLPALLTSWCAIAAQESKPIPPKPLPRTAPVSPSNVPSNAPNGISGVRPLPGSGGRGPVTIAPPGNARPTRLPNGARTLDTREGNVSTRHDGKLADVRIAGSGMEIHHNLTGNRRAAVEWSDHSRVVADLGMRGYVQRPFTYRGREYAQRTYFHHGRAYVRFYAPYPYRGAYLEMYAPTRYYRPQFYSWAYYRWAAPAPYAWGWSADPWYKYYGYYMMAYPMYPGPAYWLTDYLISTSLAEAYQSKIDAGMPVQMPPFGASPITPEVLDQIQREVQRQLAIEAAEAPAAAQGGAPNPGLSGVPALFQDHYSHIFVAAGDLDVVDTSGTECAISEGDVLQLQGPPPVDAAAADLVILSNKGGQECGRGVVVSVGLADLQEMENHMRETIDRGLAELQARQGTGGLQQIPQTGLGAPEQAAFAADPNVSAPYPAAGALINQQAQDADRAESQILGQLPADAGSAIPAPAALRPSGSSNVVSVGQSIAEVRANLGEPWGTVDVGATQIHIYGNMKLTVEGGKVTDIQ